MKKLLKRIKVTRNRLSSFWGRLIYKESDYFDLLSDEVRAKLRKAERKPAGNGRSIEAAYRMAYGPKWVDAAAAFVNGMGGLSFARKLLVWDSPLLDERLDKIGITIEEKIRARAIPVATSSYMGEDCAIWIDQDGRFYAVDGEGLVYLGEDVRSAFDVLILGRKPVPPPSGMKDRIEAAYEWNKE